MPFAVAPYVMDAGPPYAVRARPRDGADGIREGGADASGAELALDLRVEDLLALGVEALEDGRDVLARHDLVEALADARAATGQEHSDVVLRPGLGQLLDGRARVGVLLEEGLLGRQVDGRLAHRHVAGGLGEGHGVLRVRQELD